MVNWLLISVLVVAAMVILKFKEIRHQAGMLVGLGLLVFLVLSFGTISATHNVDLTTFDGVTYAGKLYVVWLKSVVSNVGSVSSYVIKQDWSIDVNTLNASVKR